MDPISGEERFTYGTLTLRDGFGLVPVAMGLFGIAEVLGEPCASSTTQLDLRNEDQRAVAQPKDWQDSAWPIARGSVLGFFLASCPDPAR